MPRPKSFRLHEEPSNSSTTRPPPRGQPQPALVATILDEGLETRCFPGIDYRDGPTSRRAAIVGGPEIREIIRALKQMPGKHERRARALSDELGLLPAQIRLAVDFYDANPSEVDDRIAADMFAGSCVSESMVESACCLGQVAA
jgi:hypothetical protein